MEGNTLLEAIGCEVDLEHPGVKCSADQKRCAVESYMDMAGRMKELLSLGKCALWEYDIENRETIWAERFCEQLEVPYYFKEITTEGRLDCLHPEDLKDYLSFMNDMLAGKVGEATAVFRYIDYDRHTYWIKWSYFCIERDKTGHSARLLGSAINITDDKRKDEHMTSLEIRHEKIIEAIPDSIFLYDRDLKIVDIYSAVEEDLVDHSSRLKGANLRECMPNDFVRLIKDKITSVLETGELHEFSYSIRVRKELRHFESRMLPFDKDMVICFIHNVSGRRKEEVKNKELTDLMDTILTYLPVNVSVKDTGDDFRYLYWNRTVQNQTGISAKEAIGRNDYELFPSSKFNDRKRKSDLELLKGEEQAEFCEKYMNLRGETCYANSLKVLVPRENEQPYIIGLSWDITDLKNKEQLLQENHLRLSLALESGNIVPWAWNIRRGRIELEDNRFKEEWIYSFGNNESLTITTLLEKTHAEDRYKLEDLIDGFSKGTVSRIFLEIRLKMQQGEYEWFEIHGLVQNVTRSGRPVKLIGCATNISMRKRAEQELVAARLKAEEADRLKSAFLANMSHEIRTPLNGIVGFANLLCEEDFSDADKRQFAETINQNSTILLTLLNDILDLSKIESGSMVFNILPCDVIELINTVIRTQEVKWKSAARLIRDLPDIPVILSIDTIRFTQVVTNLINNAAKFTRSGYVKVGCKCIRPGFVTFYVEDTGKGISENHLKNIFSRFYKVDEFDQGTGLGLSICKAIIEKFGGNISVTSQVGVGSVFSFDIPA